MSGSIKDKYVPFDSKRFVAVTHNNRAAMNLANTYSSSALYLFGLVSFCFVNL